MRATVLLLAALALVPPTACWGAAGHAVVGLVAQTLLPPGAARLVGELLSGSTLGDVAAWADTVKRKGPLAYTFDYHFADAHDDPPRDCNFDDARDCPTGACLVGAIANYTRQAGCTGPRLLPRAQRAQALKFIVHFLGDIAQPLHLFLRGRGGNDQKVVFDGMPMSLHAVWDTGMQRDVRAAGRPEKRIRSDFGGSKDSYAAHLVAQIRAAAWGDASAWISPFGPDDTNARGNSLAAIEWAVEANAIGCWAAWAPYDADPAQDFGAAYYRDAVRVVDHQIARAGVRLADWISRIAAACRPVPHGEL
ncbi:hypothetical protein HK105_206641 [Polyrhizophydium stewartii]|uniref:S1/P1 nuclease n=1 Tax=Polyrhizophydium stewartii TaxID=2732419 RepID=A0ABR4N319_9FUNG